MADGPIAIAFDSKVTIDGLAAPVESKVQLTADALVRLYVTVAPGCTEGRRIMPDAVDQPKFLLVKPLRAEAKFRKADVPDSEQDEKKKWDTVNEPITAAVAGFIHADPTDLAGWGNLTALIAAAAEKTPEPEAGLWYSTVDSGPLTADHQDQWKPLTGGHAFVSGMAEWVTDMVSHDGGQSVPGPLTELYFQNAGFYRLKRKAKDGKTDEYSTTATITVLVVAGYSYKPPKADAPAGDYPQQQQQQQQKKYDR